MSKSRHAFCEALHAGLDRSFTFEALDDCRSKRRSGKRREHGPHRGGHQNAQTQAKKVFAAGFARAQDSVRQGRGRDFFATNKTTPEDRVCTHYSTLLIYKDLLAFGKKAGRAEILHGPPLLVTQTDATRRKGGGGKLNCLVWPTWYALVLKFPAFKRRFVYEANLRKVCISLNWLNSCVFGTLIHQ